MAATLAEKEASFWRAPVGVVAIFGGAGPGVVEVEREGADGGEAGAGAGEGGGGEGEGGRGD